MYAPIDKGIIEQLEARKAIISKKEGRSNEDLKYLTSNTGWVSLSSGVNTITEAEENSLLKQEGRTTITGDPTRAKNNILLGGTTSTIGEVREGISKGGKTSYTFDEKSTGYRPMSGIVGLTVESKNTFGTLREAEVKIMAWSLKDFEEIEKLYLRPGFTMLLEWGHSTVVDNTGKVSFQALGNSIITQDFFKNGIKRSVIEKVIQDNRVKYFQNYEAMIGYVKNFSWRYLPSGAYECTVRIISTGEILDSLKFNINPRTRKVLGLDTKTSTATIINTNYEGGSVGVVQSFTKAVGKVAEGLLNSTSSEDKNSPNKSVATQPIASDDSEKRKLKSPYHYFFENLKTELSGQQGAFTRDSIQTIPEFTNRLKDFRGYHIKGDYSKGFFSIDETIDYFWLPLKVYLDIFNKFITLVDTSREVDSEEYTIVKFNTDYSKSSKILTIPEHFSIDPGICLLETVHSIPTDLPVSNAATFGKVRNVHDIFQNYADSLENKYDDVLNVLVPTVYVERILDEALAEDYENSRGATEIFQQILGGINTALGGINDLDLHYDEDSNTYFIVDRNNTTQNTPLPAFDLVGLNSIFTNIDVSSKLTNRTSTMVAVAAQGASQSYTDNLGNLLKWNTRVVDRLNRTKGTAETAVEGTAELNQQKVEDWTNWCDDVSEFFDDFATEGVGGGYTDEQKENAKTLHGEYIKYYLYYDVTTTGKATPGPIPIELSLQLEGVSGLKIGNTFKVKKGVLPSEYDGKFGYIITGLSHTVSPGQKWLTDIKTQFFPIGTSTPIGIPAGTVRQVAIPSPMQAARIKASKKTFEQVVADAKEFRQLFPLPSKTPKVSKEPYHLQMRENLTLYRAGIGNDPSVERVHKPNSSHYTDRAIDIPVPVNSTTGDRVATFWINKGYKVLWRVSGHHDHVHVQW
jgi:hypothetical protein